MTNVEIYEKIGEIANANVQKRISFSELESMLGLTGKGRGMASHVKGAYTHFSDSGDKVTAKNVMEVFVDNTGRHAYEW